MRRAREEECEEDERPAQRRRPPPRRRAREEDEAGPPRQHRRVDGDDDESHSLLPLFDVLSAHRREMQARERRALQLTRRRDASTRPPESRDTDVGDMRVAAIRRRLESFGMRSADQKAFHETFIEASLPHIYGKAIWPMVAARVLLRMRLERVRSEVLILTPRRWGKTTSVAMFVAAFLLEVPGVRVAVYSTGKRASDGVMAQVGAYLSADPTTAQRIVSRNKEQLFVSEFIPDGSKNRHALSDDKGTSKFFSYPASADRE